MTDWPLFTATSCVGTSLFELQNIAFDLKSSEYAAFPAAS